MDDDFEVRLRSTGSGPTPQADPDPPTAVVDPPQGPTPPADPLGPRNADWVRRLRRIGVGLLVLACTGGLLAGGWALRGLLPSGGVGEKKVTVERPVNIDAPAVARNGTLPNVEGLSLEEARQVYADAGVDPARIEVERTPYVGRAGTIVRQEPPAASKVTPRTPRIALIASSAPTMPDLAGRAADDARRRLGDMGVGVTAVVRYVARAKPGSVARTRPAAGEPVGARATIVVTEVPSSIGVSNLEDVAGGCSVGEGDLDGRTVTRALVCSASRDSPVQSAFKLNDRVSAFKATAGLETNAPVKARVTLLVRQGSTVIRAYSLTRAPKYIDVPLQGPRRVVIEVARMDNGSDSASAVLGNARLAGARSGIDALSKPP